MTRTSLLLTAALVLGLFAVGLSIAGPDATSTTMVDPFAPACGVQAPLFTFTPFEPLCPAVNANGCSFQDVVCSGYRCCCVYGCAGGSDVGPCWPTNPFPF